MTNAPTDNDPGQLFARAQSGDSEALEALMLAHDGLVHHVAKKWLRGETAFYDDMVQEGRIGMMKAVQDFDTTRGLRFSTYAVYKIRHAINIAYPYIAHGMRVSHHATAKHRRIMRFIAAFWQNSNREPTLQEIADNFSMTLEQAALYKGASGDVIEYDQWEDEEHITLLATEIKPEPDDDAQKKLAELIALSCADDINRLTAEELDLLHYYLRTESHEQTYRLLYDLPSTAIVTKSKRNIITNRLAVIKAKLERVARNTGLKL